MFSEEQVNIKQMWLEFLISKLVHSIILNLTLACTQHHYTRKIWQIKLKRKS